MDFLKNENIFQKTGVEITEIENATFPWKIALSETNAKTKNGKYKMDPEQRTEFSQ